MPKRTDIKTIMILGAGPIIIGQACEFDYSGAQACKALKEEGYRVVLVNSNPATIMTDPVMADATYIEPLNWKVLERIIAKEKPDAILPTMGGQTALNLAMDLNREGILKKYGVELIGAKPDVIDKAEDRQRFKEAMEKMHNSRVAVFGIGGVGGYTVEALARSGVGALDLIDDDKVCLTNLNRQIVATRKTVGQYKVDVAEQRIHEIDPNIKVTTYKIFFTPETQDQFDFTQYDYVVDAIDTVTGKIALVVKAKEAGTPIICAMGAGNKMDPTRFEVTDIYKTSVCPLAKVMRTECRKRRIKHLKVVYSKEPAMTPIEDDSISCKDHCICPPGTQRKCTVRRSVPGSNAFVPSVAGLIIGGEVVKDLVGFVPMKG